MAEICLECFNKDRVENNETPLNEKDVILNNDLCEWCGEVKPCIVIIKEKNIFKRIANFLIGIIRVIYYVFRFR